MPSLIQPALARLATLEAALALTLLAGAGLGLSACTADKVGGDVKPDAAPLEVLDPPTLNTVPSQTPHQSVVVEGITEGTRIVVQGASNGTFIKPVLPGGNFCEDVVLDTDGATEINVYAAKNGALSEPVRLEVEYDPQAAPPAKKNCGDTTGDQCGEVEICGNDVDDDCNSYTDECDLTCSGCVDDSYEPNDAPFNVPAIAAGSYPMQLCPCREDWFSFTIEDTGRVRANADFVHSQIDIDMRLYKSGAGGGTGDLVASSATSTDDESIDFTVETPGVYLLRVYSFPEGNTDKSGSYTLSIL